MFTKILTSSLLFLVAIGGFFMSSLTYAGQVPESSGGGTNTFAGAANTYLASTSSAAPEKKSEAEQKWLNEMIQAYNGALGIITVIVSPAIIFAGWLMSPDWTSGDLFGLRDPMHKIWVVVSNITYFVYAILLIIIALATILGKENFSYKAMLPKLALGILMVPFTWWFVQWTVSLSTVVTASTIGIPMEMIKNDNRYINGNFIPTKYLTTTTTKDSGTETAAKCNNANIGQATADCTNIQALLETGAGLYSPLLIYAYQVFRIQDDKTINTASNPVKTAGQLLNGVVMGGIMFLVFGVLTVALIVVLFVRAVKLWMYAMFSPLFTLHFVAGKELFKDSDSFSIKEFIGLCFMPAIVGLTLSFGLMIISVIQSPQESAQPRCTTPTLVGNNIYDLDLGCKLISVFGNAENTITRGDWIDGNGEKWVVNIIKIAGLTYVYKGVATNGHISVADSANNITGGLSAAGGIFGTLIINIIALIFIWVAFMAAKGVNKTISKVLDPFEKLGKDVGGMAMSAPKYIPIPGTNGQSLGSLQKAGTEGMRHLESSQLKKAEAAATRVAPWAFQGMIKQEDKKAIEDIRVSPESKNGKIEDIIKKYAPHLKDASDSRKDAVDFVKNTLKETGSQARWDEFIRTITDERTKKAFTAVREGKADEEQSKLVFNYVKGAGGASTTASATTATTKPDSTTGNGTINIGGVSINYNGIKDVSKVDDIAAKISTEIKDKASTMKKPTVDEIKAQLDAMGMTSANAKDAANKIIEAIKSATFKE